MLKRMEKAADDGEEDGKKGTDGGEEDREQSIESIITRGGWGWKNGVCMQCDRERLRAWKKETGGIEDRERRIEGIIEEGQVLNNWMWDVEENGKGGAEDVVQYTVWLNLHYTHLRRFH